MNTLGINITNNLISYAILNEDENIITSGVRIFDEVEIDGNIKRREQRSKRRILRRRKFRLLRLKRLLKQYQIIDNINFNFYSQNENPYLLRKKGLTEELTNEELAKALYNILKHRGSLDLDISEDDEEGTKGILMANEKRLVNKYICEIQLENLANDGVLRGKNNTFKTKDYIKEVSAILVTQQKFNKKIDKNFVEKIIDLINSRRLYYQGPGQESPYSWKDEEEWLNQLMGTCTYFPNEIRMIKHSYTAELFNLLNDLNNLKINGKNSLSIEDKKELLSIFKKQKSVSLKKIAKSLGISEDDISGYRIDPKGKPIFTALETYIDITNIFPSEDRNLIDNIARICTYYQDKESRLNKLKILLEKFDVTEEILDKLSDKKYAGTHSLSKKLMDMLIPEMLETNKNSIQIISEKKLVPYKMDFTKSDKIPSDYIDKWILNPNVRKNCKQVILILNELLKEYRIDKIVFKSLEKKNSFEERERIKKENSKNKDFNDEIKKILTTYKLPDKYFMLIKLWKEQDCRCIYSGEFIKLDDIIQKPEAYEVSHIIPISISFDFSQNNSVFSKKSENNKKGSQTCYEYLNSISSSRTFENFKEQVEELYKNQKISKGKRNRLLIEETISKYCYNNLNKILSDNSYVMKSIIELLTKYFKDKKLKIKIETVNAGLFNIIKRKNKILNDKIYYKERIGDSILLVKINSIIRNIRYLNLEEDERVIYHVKTGEIMSDTTFLDLFKFPNFNRKMDEIKFNLSTEKDKKANRKLANETIYSTRQIEGVEYQIQKFGIYDKICKKVDDFFGNKEKYSKLLIFNSDRKTFDKMLDIYLKYKKETKKGENPFYLYYQENGYITTARENGGVPVKELKILGDNIKIGFDLSHKYINPKKRVLVTKLSGLRLDFYKKKDENKYKFLIIRYLDLKEVKDGYLIEQSKYNAIKNRKNIDENYEFVCSIYKGDKFKVNDGNTEKKYIYRGVNNELQNRLQVIPEDKNYINYITEIIELKKKMEDLNYQIRNRVYDICNIEFDTEEEAREYISKYPTSTKQQIIYLKEDKIKSFKKVHTNLLGKEYNASNNEKLRLYFPKNNKLTKML